MTDLVMGIDVGTQGVRVLVVDATGTPKASASRQFESGQSDLPPGWSEQDPEAWWTAVKYCINKVMTGLAKAGYQPEDVTALAVDSTSGTVVVIDPGGKPLRPALMYNDARSQSVLPEVREACRELEAKLGYSFNSSFALPKILWLYRNEPHQLQNRARFIHAADFVVGRLTGNYAVSDHSNSLKTGFDLIDYCWPSTIEETLEIPLDRLPRVVSPGEVIAAVSSQASNQTGLSTSTLVAAGMTDGSAAQLASGATVAGSWNSILGTTLVIKGITSELIKDPQGRVYCHRHPQGYWMPGGASNTGCEWIVRQFPNQNPIALDAAAAHRLPTNLISYPLARIGERFPFVHTTAEGFTNGSPAEEIESYAANLEGVAYLERLAYETLASIDAEITGPIYVTGGGARSVVWLKVRASVLSLPVARPTISETAMGSALLAASNTLYSNVNEASAKMTTIELTVDPEPAWLDLYAENYGLFLNACRDRGYLQ